MRRPAKAAWISIGTGIALAAMTPASAHATPSTGASAVTLSKQTVDGKDYIVSDITIAPGGSTGWHPAGAPTSDSALNPGCDFN